MAYYDFLCNQCSHVFEETVGSETRLIDCPHCETRTAERLPVLIGGYQGNMGGASTRPKNSTSMKRATVFTGNKEDKK